MPARTMDVDEKELSEMLVQFLEKLDDSPSSHVELVEEFCSSNPDLAQAFRRSVAELAEAGLLDEEATAEDPETYGPYRVRGRLGAGGMGIVYLAEREGDPNPVALKVLRPAELVLGGRSRFEREAEAAAKLDHPDIASLIDRDLEGEQPYLAFEVAAGDPLDAVLRRNALRPPHAREPKELGGAAEHSTHEERANEWIGAAATLVARVARSVKHAHERGVLHRDIKPANVVVDDDGSPTLLDFGLAALDGTPRLTRSGAQLGSLPYMAPEQVLGDRSAIDARTDVYGLGVTLYETLTLRQPFAAPTAQATRERVLAGRAVAPREHAPEIPRPLEIACLKAMDVEARHRYATAREFAADLERWLERGVVDARPPSAIRRLRRFAAARPAATVGAAAGLVALVAIPSTFAVVSARETEQAEAFGKRISGLLDIANDERAAAEASLGVAREAILDLVAEVGAEDLRKTPELEEVRAKVLQGSRDLFERLYTTHTDDVGVLEELSKLTVQHAIALHDLGREDDAEAAYSALDELVDEMHERGADDRVVLEMRARAYYMRGVTLFNAFEYGEVFETWKVVDSDTLRLLDDDPTNDTASRLRADAASNASSAAAHLGRFDDAAATAAVASDVARRFAQDDSGDLGLAILASNIHSNLGATMARCGRLDEAREYGELSLALSDRCREIAPDDPKARFAGVRARNQFGDVLRRSGSDTDLALEMLADARRECAALAADFPSVQLYFTSLHQIDMRRAGVLSGAGRHGEAIGAMREAAAATEEWLEHAPSDRARIRRTIITHLNCAVTCLDAEGPDLDPEELARRAREHTERCLELIDSVPEEERAGYSMHAYWSWSEQAIALGRLGEVAAWSAVARMDEVGPGSAGVNSLTLRAYDALIPLAEAGTIDESTTGGGDALAWIRERVTVALESWVQSPRAEIDEYRSMKHLPKIHDDRIEALIERLETKD